MSSTAPLAARLLTPFDDVATALSELPEGALVEVENAGTVRRVTLAERIPAGHKFALRPLGAGLRIRKYGELIGRLTSDVAEGAWVHVHNLVTSARRDPRDDTAWSRAMEAPRALEVIGDVVTTVGESPVYDQETDALWWIDVRETPSLFRRELSSGRERAWPQREDVGSIALAGSGRLLVAGRNGFGFFDVARGSLDPIVDPEAHLPQTRMNDGKCDAAGRFWCGSTHPESGVAEGSLYSLDAALEVQRWFGDVFMPNGIAFSIDGKTMYFADTRRSMIYVFDFDPANGTPSNRRVFADLGALPGGPDGASVDRDGGLWSAHVDAGCLIRYTPDGRTDRVVGLPVSRPTSCTFGGPGYDRLYVTTATRALSAEQRRAEPMAGRVLVLDVGAKGLPPASFAG